MINFGLPIGAATALSYEHDWKGTMDRQASLQDLAMKRESHEMDKEQHQINKDKEQRETNILQHDLLNIATPGSPYYAKKWDEENADNLTAIAEIEEANPYWSNDPEAFNKAMDIKSKMMKSDYLLQSTRLLEEEKKLYDYINSNPGSVNDPDIRRQMEILKNEKYGREDRGEPEKFFFSRPNERKGYDNLNKAALRIMSNPSSTRVYPSNGSMWEVHTFDPDRIKLEAGIEYYNNKDFWANEFTTLSGNGLISDFNDPLGFVEHWLKMQLPTGPTWKGHAPKNTDGSSGGKIDLENPYDLQVTSVAEYAVKNNGWANPNANFRYLTPTDDDGRVLTDKVMAYSIDPNTNEVKMTAVTLPGQYNYKLVHADQMYFDKTDPETHRFVKAKIIVDLDNIDNKPTGSKDGVTKPGELDLLKAEMEKLFGNAVMFNQQTQVSTNRVSNMSMPQIKTTKTVAFEVLMREDKTNADRFNQQFLTTTQAAGFIGKHSEVNKFSKTKVKSSTLNSPRGIPKNMFAEGFYYQIEDGEHAGKWAIYDGKDFRLIE